jgi:hypothetical protein
MTLFASTVRMRKAEMGQSPQVHALREMMPLRPSPAVGNVVVPSRELRLAGPARC